MIFLKQRRIKTDTGKLSITNKFPFLPDGGDDLAEEDARFVLRQFVLGDDVVEKFAARTILDYHEYRRRRFDHLEQFRDVLMAERERREGELTTKLRV